RYKDYGADKTVPRYGDIIPHVFIVSFLPHLHCWNGNETIRCCRTRPRARGLERRKVRFSSCQRIAGTRILPYRQAGRSGSAIPAGDGDFHAIRNLLQLCVVSGCSESKCGSERVGAATFGEEANHAGISAPPRAALVPKSEQSPEASKLRN